MTTIQEMDEFFNFEDAAHAPTTSSPSHFLPSSGLALGPYSIPHAFADIEADENSFSALQHYTNDNPTNNDVIANSNANFYQNNITPEQQLSLDIQNGLGLNVNGQDTSILSPADLSDFPRWIEGMDVPARPCAYCERLRLHCKVLKEGSRIGSCTSCVALSRACSLTERISDGQGNKESSKRYSFGSGSEVREDEAWSEADEGKMAYSTSAPDLKALGAGNGHDSSMENLALAGESGAPKVGARFSRESVRVLRGWLSVHHRHPYPTDEEKESLKRQTGLNKTQITNWLANARRRGKVRAPRSTSPSPQQFANGMDIPRRGTPALNEMNPLERWKQSPPEHEPASVTAIAKAVSTSTFSSGLDSPYTRYGQSDDGSARSLCNVSSTSSFGTSLSSANSFASAFSHKSRNSLGSFSSLSLNHRGRRRRRRQNPKPAKANLFIAPRTFQCTFCTETFKTKHDWQRHEKSLHLSLERWVCSPEGHTQLHHEKNARACVYCGTSDPEPGHEEKHGHSGCAERGLEERTFYRKDHLRQHLNLVHGARFQAWAMDGWKVTTPEIRSRCGFCGITMATWSIRVDHLAEHFKAGKSMADWKGDWGFEPQVLDLIENGMPPYLIHDERNTMNPFEAKFKDRAEVHKTLEDQVKTGLVDYINEQVLTGSIPTDDDLLEEARKVIRKEEALKDYPAEASWFRDLIMLSGATPYEDTLETKEAKSNHLSWVEKLDLIHSQNQTNMNDLNEISCAKERLLKTYVKTRSALGLTPVDSELQVQACQILDEIEATSNFKCKGAVQWFKYLITSSTSWLAEFRRRAVLPRSSEMGNERVRSSDDRTIDYSIHNYHRLERELIEFVNEQRAVGKTPTDADLQAKARMIIFENDDTWNQTAADDPAYLEVFKRQNGLATIAEEEMEVPTPTVVGALGLSLLSHANSPPSQTYSSPSPRSLHWDLEHTGIGLPSPVTTSDRPYLARPRPGTGTFTPPNAPLHTTTQNQPSTNTNPTQPLRYFLNDCNCYGRLVRELTRFVTSATSPNNPAQHTPSDAELQNQARWVIYDDDDPWNQTAADNAEWLARFKRDVGLLPSESGPGLPLESHSWRVPHGGSGFSPPYLHPAPGKTLPVTTPEDEIPVRMEHTLFSISNATAAGYAGDLCSGKRFAPPGKVFCSRELEHGLVEMVRDFNADGKVVSDAELRARARVILGIDRTAADDAILLAKFREVYNLAPEGNTELDISTGFGNSGAGAGMAVDGAQDDNHWAIPDLPDFDMDLDMDMLNTFNMDMDFSTDFLDHQNQPVTNPMLDPSIPASVADPLSFETFVSSPKYQVTSNRGDITNKIADMREYADSYKVAAATASPLRRSVSVKMARDGAGGGTGGRGVKF